MGIHSAHRGRRRSSARRAVSLDRAGRRVETDPRRRATEINLPSPSRDLPGSSRVGRLSLLGEGGRR